MINPNTRAAWRVRTRAYAFSLHDAVSGANRDLQVKGCCTLVFLFVVFSIAVLFIIAAVDVANINRPRYTPMCTHGGTMLSTAWINRPWCVPVANANANVNATTSNETLSVGEQAPRATAPYPAEDVFDTTPFKNTVLKNPVTVLVLTVVLLCPALVLYRYVQSSLADELEANFNKRKREEEMRYKLVKEDADADADTGTEEKA